MTLMCEKLGIEKVSVWKNQG